MIFQTQCSKFGYALMDMSNVTKLHHATNLLHPMTMGRWVASKKPPPPLWWKVAWRMSAGITWCTTTECLTTTARNLPVVPACRRRDQLGHARPVRLGYSSKRRHRPPMAIALYSSESPMAQNQWESGMCELQNFKKKTPWRDFHIINVCLINIAANTILMRSILCFEYCCSEFFMIYFSVLFERQF